jgi:NADH-quinone oxidoreductase subunit E
MSTANREKNGENNHVLTKEEIQDIEDECSHYPDKQAVSVDALKIVQRHRGYVSDEALQDVGEYLQMPFDELEGVATFYPLIFRKPVGKHVILVCDSISCWIMGGEDRRKDLEQRLGIHLGETTPDGLFTLLPIRCLGICDHAPALIIDEELVVDWTNEKTEAIMNRYSKMTEKAEPSED